MRIFTKLFDLLYVPVCFSCRIRIDSGALCPHCLDVLRENMEGEFCPSCLKTYDQCCCASPVLKNAGVRRHYKLFRYDPQLPDAPESRLLYALKHTQNKALQDFLGGMLATVLPSVKDRSNMLVTFMPRTRSAFFAEGVDASQVLAHAIASRCDLPCRSCFRHVGKRKQKQLSVTERILNAQKSYKLKVLPDDISGKHILLVDDVSTTDATLAAGARLLRCAGAKSVTAVTLAVSHRSAYA